MNDATRLYKKTGQQKIRIFVVSFGDLHWTVCAVSPSFAIVKVQRENNLAEAWALPGWSALASHACPWSTCAA